MSGTYTLVYYFNCGCGLLDSDKEFLDPESRSQFITAHLEEYPEDEELVHDVQKWEIGV